MCMQNARFLSSWLISASYEKPRGFLVPTERREQPGGGCCLRSCKNAIDRKYEENHLEEWVARSPAAVFTVPAMLLASQNYVFLPERVDLLFMSSDQVFQVVEAKIKGVQQNGGVVPDEIYGQMGRYVEFLTRHGRDFPGGMESDYGRFSDKFYGARHVLTDDLIQAFGTVPTGPLAIQEVYLAERFDGYAVDRLSTWAARDGRRVRLVYYRFYPRDQYIEFWETCK